MMQETNEKSRCQDLSGPNPLGENKSSRFLANLTRLTLVKKQIRPPRISQPTSMQKMAQKRVNTAKNILSNPSMRISSKLVLLVGIPIFEWHVCKLSARDYDGYLRRHLRRTGPKGTGNGLFQRDDHSRAHILTHNIWMDRAYDWLAMVLLDRPHLRRPQLHTLVLPPRDLQSGVAIEKGSTNEKTRSVAKRDDSIGTQCSDAHSICHCRPNEADSNVGLGIYCHVLLGLHVARLCNLLYEL
ncbi:hypothetical protein G7054_g4105 [Neopestalotiopsis clavispora]|nr:hypothetical protein G7054_g4105 [Neopestalotiopsis clavispora]